MSLFAICGVALFLAFCFIEFNAWLHFTTMLSGITANMIVSVSATTGAFLDALEEFTLAFLRCTRETTLFTTSTFKRIILIQPCSTALQA